MKYIRTKDGIYELMFPNEEQQMSFDHKTIEPAYYTTKNDWVAKKDVIKYADTVEELIDELVVVEPNNEDCPRPYVLDCFYLCGYNSWFEREKEHIKNGTIVVYGSIWVNDELRKVAKMNDKGELELL